MTTSNQQSLEPRIIYSLPCRLGLWNEDLAIQEGNNTITAYKRDHCQMLNQKIHKMMRNLLKPTVLAYDTSHVTLGQNYQVKTSDLKSTLKTIESTKGLFLSGLITEKEIDTCQHFTHGCILTASPMKQRVLRNTFTIVGCEGDNTMMDQSLMYGKDFMFKISESRSPLYVQCENHTIDSFGTHLSLRLSSVPDFYCRFKVLHWNPKWRYESLGTAITPDSRVVIQHSASGQNLAVEPHRWIPTFFGPECIVSCYTCRDTHKMETAENFWMLLSEPKNNTDLFVRAAKGEDIPSDIFE